LWPGLPKEEGGLPCSCNVAAAGCGIQKYAATGVNDELKIIINQVKL